MSTNGSMAMSMGPPMLPGYSLRVQLFAPNAYSATDAPIRSFRVVTSPEVSLRDFCQEVSRVHTLNYGSPISIKKCQDDQLFDITQSDLLGPLFQNAATIRIIQAASTPNLRDSVPPTSALRYDFQQVAGRKRDRSASVEPNASPRNDRRFNKRQRISDLNPDYPIPSREQEPDVARAPSQAIDDHIIPDSQRSSSVVLGNREDRRILEQTFGSSLRAKSASYHISRPQERGRSVSTAATSPLSAEQQPEPTNSNSKVTADPKSLDTIPKSHSKKSKPQNEQSVYDDIPSDSEGDGSATLKRTRAALKIKSSPKAGLSGLNRSKNGETPPGGSRRSSEMLLTPDSKARKERQNSEVASVEGSHLKPRRAAAAAAEERLRKAEEDRRAAESERLAEQLAEEERQVELERQAELQRQAETERLVEEKRRLAEEKRLAQEERQAKEKKLAQEKKLADERRQAELDRLAEEKRQTDEMNRIAEEARIAKEARKVEAARIAEEARLAEEARKAEDTRKAEVARQNQSLRSLRERTAELSKKKSATPERIPSNEVTPNGEPRRSTSVQSSTSFIPKGRPASAIKSALSAKSLSPELSKKSPEVERRGVGIEDQMPLSKHRRVSFRDEPDVNIFPPQTEHGPAVTSSPVMPRSTVPNSSQASTSILPPKKYKETPVPPPKRISATRLKFSGPEEPRRQTSIPGPSSQTLATPNSKHSKIQETLKSSSAPHLQPHAASTPKLVKSSLPADSNRRSMTPNLSNTRGQRDNSSVSSSMERNTTPAAQRILPPPLLSTRKSVPNEATPKPERLSSTTSSNGKSVPIIPAKANSASLQTSKKVSNTPSPVGDTSDFHLPESTQTILPTSTLPPQAKANPGGKIDDDNDDADSETSSSDDEDEEMESDRSSLRESRSPIVFNQYPVNPQPTQKVSSLEDDEAKSTDSESTSSDDGPKIDGPVLKPALKLNKEDDAMELDDELESSTDSDSVSDSDSDSEDAEKGADQSQVKTQGTTRSEVLLPKLTKHPRTFPHSSSSSLSTQEEVDNQLTSSMNQVTQSSPSPFVSSKTETTPKPHSMKYGVSLSQLHSSKMPLDNGISSTANRTAKGSQSALRSLQEQSDDEISSEEDDDSSSDSSDSDAPRPSSRAAGESAKKSRVISGYTFGRPP